MKLARKVFYYSDIQSLDEFLKTASVYSVSVFKQSHTYVNYAPSNGSPKEETLESVRFYEVFYIVDEEATKETQND